MNKITIDGTMYTSQLTLQEAIEKYGFEKSMKEYIRVKEGIQEGINKTWQHISLGNGFTIDIISHILKRITD